MPKQIIFVDMVDQYPFLENNQRSQGSSLIQVRKTLQYDQEPRFIYKEKIRMVKSLGFQNLIGLESSQSEQNAIVLAFQYVPFQLTALANSLDSEKTAKIQRQLLELCESLASKSIVHEFEQKRIGLDKRHHLKYFLGVDFKIDKNQEKGKLLTKYQSFVSDCLSKYRKLSQKPQLIALTKPNDSEAVNNLFEDLQISVRNLFGSNQPRQRKMLKKSSIIVAQNSSDDFKARKASTRFTFNCDNQIRLPIGRKEDECPQNKLGNQKSKKEDLFTRINILKRFMKQISVKTYSNGFKPKDGEDQFSKNINLLWKSPQTPNFSKFQKKVNDFRQSRLRKSSRDQQTLKQKVIDKIGVHSKVYPCKSLQDQQNNSKNECKYSKQSQKKQSLFNTVKSPCNISPTINFAKKNSLNIREDDRQQQQYVMLANNDQYCAEFMMFLEDNQGCDQRSQRTVKKSSQYERAYLNTPSLEQCRPSRKTSNLKTQSSQNTLEIQSRVQRVITSSLKLISGLRSRQSIRCQ